MVWVYGYGFNRYVSIYSGCKRDVSIDIVGFMGFMGFRPTWLCVEHADGEGLGAEVVDHDLCGCAGVCAQLTINHDFKTV
jgi:hypothetical protein